MDITKMERLLLESLFARKRVHRRWTERHTMIELNWPDSAGSTENTGENCHYALSRFRHARIRTVTGRSYLRRIAMQ